MTRKHFELIARAIRETGIKPADKMLVACQLAGELRATNPSFNRERFIDACLKEA